MLANELLIRLGCVIGISILMAVWGGLAPCREGLSLRATRWASNIGSVILNSPLIRLIFPTAAVGLALAVGQNGWGLFNILSLPYVLP